ncbi:MAG: hypothetical protein R3B40_13880 [Polyangiales bacterium]
MAKVPSQLIAAFTTALAVASTAGCSNAPGGVRDAGGTPDHGSGDVDASVEADSGSPLVDGGAGGELGVGDAGVDAGGADSGVDAGGADSGVDAGSASPINYVFVTSADFAASDLGSALGADALCQAAAEAGDPRLAGRTYVAWVSDSTSHALGRVAAASGWVRLDGEPFAVDRPALVAGRVLYPPRLDEHGDDVATTASTDVDLLVFSGTGSTGFHSAGNSCADWSGTTGQVMGGFADATDRQWGSGFGTFCSRRGRLVCLGVDYDEALTALPEPPSTARRVFSTAVAATATSRGHLDAACQTAADGAGLSGTFLALVSSTSGAAADFFVSDGGPWFRSDGVRAISDPAAFLAGGLPDAPLGQSVVDPTYTTRAIFGGAVDWTATSAPGEDCGFDFDSGVSIARGWSWRSSRNLFSSPFGTTCDSPLAIICLQQ